MNGPSIGVLQVVMLLEAAYFLVALGLLFGHAAWLRREEHRFAGLMLEGRAALTRALGSGALSPDDVATLGRLPLSRQTQLISEWEANLSGQGSALVAELSRHLGMVRAAERMCRSWRWAQRVRGIRILTLLSEGTRVVPALFQDSSPVVRSQAAYWATAHPTAESIAALLQMLSDSDRFCRFAASDALHRMGTAVIDPLVQFVTREQGPQVDHAMAVLSVIGDEHFVHVARAMIAAESPVTRAFAVKVLGMVGGVAQVGLLVERLQDPVSMVREAAASAIGNLGHWPTAPQVARLLGDPEWNVRRAAGLALRGLGAPGHLFLRRALKGADRYAVDMARHVLDLPTRARMATAS